EDSVVIFLLRTFTSSARINISHYHLFHGWAERAGVPFPNSVSHFLGDNLSDPLLLTRNGINVPEVFIPATSLVVSSALAEPLKQLPHVILLPTVLKKVVAYAYTPGDFSYFDRPEFQRDPWREDPETLLDRLPDVPSLHQEIGPFFE